MTSAKTSQQFSHYVSRSAPGVVAIVVTAALVIGWIQRDEEYLTPKNGLGYWLGIVGGLMMLALLFYSYRKRVPAARGMGSIPTWFRIHMFLGIFGPLLIVYHSNFRLGALNSNVAFFAMLIVAASGVIGRYIYGKIHMGVYGRKAVAKEILADVETLHSEIDHDVAGRKEILSELDAFGRRALESPPVGALSSLAVGATMTLQAAFLKQRLRHSVSDFVRGTAQTEGWSWWEQRRRTAAINSETSAYINAVLKAMELRFFERVFGLWHVLHLPIFFLMVLAVVVHIWAVHRY